MAAKSFELSGDIDIKEKQHDTPGVIHDANNLLCAIMSTSDMLSMELPEYHSAQKRIRSIIYAADQCSELLMTLLGKSEFTPEKIQRIELVPFIESVIGLIKDRKKQSVTIEVYHKNRDLSFSGCALSLGSALMNLCINALDAMPEGGVLRIQTYTITKNCENGEFKIGLAAHNEYLLIDVSDTGIGISSEFMEHIFDPGFSTKQKTDTKKRGLGLFRVKHCIELQGGTIKVRSAPFAGTTFTIMLPVTYQGNTAAIGNN